MEFYLWVDEQQQGPFQLEDLRKRMDKGDLAPETNTWRAGMRDWQPLSDVLTQEDEKAAQAKLNISKPNAPLKLTRNNSKPVPALKIGTASTPQMVAKATTGINLDTSNQTTGETNAKTVSIQGSLKRGLAADLSKSGGKTQMLGATTGNLSPHSATQTGSQTLRVSGATAQQYTQALTGATAEIGPDGLPIDDKNTKGLVGFILGCVSVAILPFSFVSLVGIFFSVAGFKSSQRVKLNKAGFFLNIAGILLFIIGIIVVILSWSFIAGLLGKADEKYTDSLPEKERIERKIAKEVNLWASENKGRAPRGSQGRKLVKELGFEDKVEYQMGPQNDTYQLQFFGDDGELGTEDDPPVVLKRVSKK